LNGFGISNEQSIFGRLIVDLWFLISFEVFFGKLAVLTSVFSAEE
jgi:hypothetical protein